MHVIRPLWLFEIYPLNFIRDFLQLLLSIFSPQYNFFDFFTLLYMSMSDVIYHLY